MIAWFLLGSAIAYGLLLTIYRLHIHPLSRFPGPRLAALTGLYELICTAWGVGSFDGEIDRMHRVYGDIVPELYRISDAVLTCSEGPVVRITPDEVHIQEQLYNPKYADSWIKGSRVLDADGRQSEDTTQRFQIRKRSIWQVQSILQVEIHQIIRGLVRKHQVHREFSWRVRPLISITEHRGTSTEGSDLEDGSVSASRSARGRSMSRSGQESKDQLPTPGHTGPRSWRSRGFSGQAWYSTMQGMGGRSLPF